jgi:hypothetical protein
VRCPQCGATNPDTAAWCGQCLQRFDQLEAPAPDAAEIPEPATDDGLDVLDGAAVVPTEAPIPPPTTEGAEGFRREGDEVQWQCPQCDRFNSIEVQHCEVCGTAFFARFQEQQVEPPRNWNAALLMSVLAPGAGHISVGRYGTGVARLVLYLGWVIGAMAVTSFAGGRGALVVTPLILAALVLWAGSIVDVYRLQHGDKELLGGRSLLWLVVGTLILMGLGLFAAVAGQGG